MQHHAPNPELVTEKTEPVKEVTREHDLERLARKLGELHLVTQEDGRRRSLADELGAYKSLFRDAIRFFRGAVEQEPALSSAAEWMLDNDYLVQRAIRQVEQDLPPRFYRQLPKLATGPLAGYPRIYVLAREIILVEDAYLDLDRVRSFVHSYEAINPLTMGELWALPIMLRIGILQSLLQAVLRLAHLLKGKASPSLTLIDLSPWISDSEVVANCFISLRTIAAQDWKEFFESLSLVELLLNRDPADLYSRMDFDTRDRYRKVVEGLALATGKDERDVARQAIRLAQQELDRLKLDTSEEWTLFSSPRPAHVGFFLLDRGLPELEKHLEYRPSWKKRLQRWIFAHAALVYLGSIGLLSLFILAILAGYVLRSGGGSWGFIVAGLLGAIPAVTMAVTLVNWIVTKTVPPRVLPKMDFKDGFPVECSTLVVVPALLTGSDEIRSLLLQLELHYLRNPIRNFYFALLTDFEDAPEQHMPGDDELVEEAVQGIEALNERYGTAGRSPFFLFHRQRIWNPGEGTWMGWERKRGKLHELNQLILQMRLSGASGSHRWDGSSNGKNERSSNPLFSVRSGDLSALKEIRYVITLDADTVLPRESGSRLVATLAHPLNRVEFSALDGKVTAGYSVLQPRTEISPVSANQSLFTRVFAGDTGLDLYTLAVSDVYQDLFGEGIYVGKGIYDVEAFERSLAGRVPENALLSHDLFEGIHGRAGLATDIVLIEDYPPHYLVHIRRLHRWIRGDWQLLPWLFPRVPAGAETQLGSMAGPNGFHAAPAHSVPGGAPIPNRLSVISRWKIVDNLRRSLVPPVLLGLFVLGWLSLPGSPLFWTLFGIFTLAVPLLTTVLDELVQVVSGSSLRRAVTSVQDAGLRWLLALAFLPYEALIVFDAIGGTLLRLFVTRRKMLRWTTAAQSARRFGEQISFQIAWKQMIPALLLALGLALLVGLVKPAVLPVASPLLIVWLLSPEIAYWVSRPIRREISPMTAGQMQELRHLARRTWLFFEQYVGPEDHWLPPDHFQETPLGAVAHRTSPTNIGLALVSTLGAYDMGYIDLLHLTTRLRSTFDTFDRLERYRGHFLNWYDTRSLEHLPPRYVSTVDSGNLAACLIALGQGCLAISQARVLRWETWEGILDSLSLLEELIEGLEATQARQAALKVHEALSQIRQQILGVQGDPDAWASLLFYLAGEEISSAWGFGGYLRWDDVDRRLVDLVELNGTLIDAGGLRRLRIYATRFRERLDNAVREIKVLLPWLLPFKEALIDGRTVLFNRPNSDPDLEAAWRNLLDAFSSNPSLSEIDQVQKNGRAALLQLRERLETTGSQAGELQAAREWCASLVGRLDSTGMAAKVLYIGLQELARQAEDLVQAMDFGFLFDADRQVFHIGYNLELGQFDSNYYDLLASEARIASLVAIAKGDIPQSHWLHLSRPLTQVDGTRMLLSWSATMFEYLMPDLLLRNYEGTLLDQTADAVVDYQIAYGRQKGVPWGISESGYFRFDANLVYQYRAFGVPGLGYKRGLEEDLVITPYASLLALSLRPQDVMNNIEDLERLQAMGTFGLYEAVDFTPARLSLGNSYEVVREYMAHHQGMILLSAVNYLCNQIMVERFHADPRIQSVELLLQEQIPHNVPTEQPHAQDGHAILTEQPRLELIPWRARLQVPQPRVHILTNGRYGVLLTSSGSGSSAWKEIDLTRWRADITLNDWGTWIYVQDQEGGDFWSAGFQPTGVSPESQSAFFNAHIAEYRRRDRDISLTMEVTVDPEADVEVRRITMTNHSDRRRRLRLTSYGEVVLVDQPTDRRHPAFNKLFIESEWHLEGNSLLFRRRPRSEKEEVIFLAHAMVGEPGLEHTGAHESDRLRFLGRGQTVRSPQALTGPDWLSGTTGATLDPIFSIGQEVELLPHESAQIAFITLVAGTRQEAINLVGSFQAWHRIDRAFDQARLQAEVELRQIGLTTAQLEPIQRLLSLMLYPHAVLRAGPQTLTANRKGQPALWAYSISGDHPILLVKVNDQNELSLVHELLQAHAYWRNRQLKIDLVILNQQGTNYGQELNSQLHRLLERTHSEAWLNRRGGIFILYADQIPEPDRVLLETVARAILDGEKASLPEQLAGMDRLPSRLPPFNPTSPDLDEADGTPALLRPGDLHFDNGYGGFSPDGREYIAYLEPGRWTPAPWINVIANPEFGFLVSEMSLGFTWSCNSGENRLTPWSNDPVTDTPAEALYLRDEETAKVWSPTPLPARDSYPYLVRHGAGYSIFEHNSQGLKQYLRLYAVPDAPVKIIHLRMENTWSRVRRITVTYYAEWVLGVNRETAQPYVVPEFDGESQALLARNAYHSEFGERVAFAAASRHLHGLTADRTEFLGRMGSRALPAALGRIGLASTVEPGIDPCAVLQVHLDIQPGETGEVYFLLGQGADREEAIRLVKQYQDPEQAETAWVAVEEFWDRILGTVQLRTPDPAMDLLLNRWLLYQALSCRIWGRSAFYQSSGAYGFRDQLQDVMTLTFAAPEIAREHLLRAAAHQFDAGDVLHWWHPPSGRGVRTRFSDDLLWLPFVTAHYVQATGDLSVLEEKISFKKGPPLEEGEEERYGQYAATLEEYSLFEHCRRALEKGSTFGPHGLPLMGSGDWNDGMNRVGIGGRGESIWLGWFLIRTLMDFAEVCMRLGLAEQAGVFQKQAEAYRQALETSAWDGAWYLRAFYDDGTPLGSSRNRECQIDSIAQSWAALSGAGDSQRTTQAMESVSERLVRPEDRLLLLFTPPFDKTPKDPGYIKGYLPGIRENGGQYTHAALWSIWAYTQLGQGDYAEQLFRMINPVYHSDTPEKAVRYKVEPYVIAADVYGVPPHTGRGGWTWYTGSSGWMYRLGVEAILGLRRAGDVFLLEPCIPKGWAGFEMSYRLGETCFRIVVRNSEGAGRGVRQVTLDGELVEGGKIPLLNDSRQHYVSVIMG